MKKEDVDILVNLRQNILQKFNYVKNEAYLHTDEKLMPRKKRLGLVGILFQMEIRHV